MEEFYFYQDRKVTCWERDFFTVQAESYEEAVSIVKARYGEGLTEKMDDRVQFDECRPPCETSENITPKENGGCPTLEVFDNNGNFIIANAPSPLLDGDETSADK